MQNYNYANAGAAVPTPGPGTTSESVTVDHTWNAVDAGAPGAHIPGFIQPGGTLDSNAVYQGTQTKDASGYMYTPETVAAHNSTTPPPIARMNLASISPDISNAASPSSSLYQGAAAKLGSTYVVTPGPDNVPTNTQFDK